MASASPPIAPHRSIRSAMLLALAGFALLSIGDGIIKSINGEWPPTAVATLRYLFGTVMLTLLLGVREGPRSFSTHRPWLHLGRGASVAIGGSCFFGAIFLMPLADATAIQFISPMFVAFGSALFMRERISKAVWTSIALAFCGVLIVLRPNLMELGLVALLPMVTALMMASMMIFNQMAAGDGGPLKMQFLISAFALPVLFGITGLSNFSPSAGFALAAPSASVIIKCAIVSVTASCAHGLIYMATERASAAKIAPMTYVQLLVSTAIGMAVYHNMPDWPTILGSALIVGAGLLLWRAQTR